MKLTAKLIITFVLAALIPTTVLSFLNYSSAKKTLKNQTLEYVGLIAEAKEGQLYGFFETVKNRAVDFSADGVIRKSMQMIKALDAEDPPYTQLQKSLSDHLRHKMTLDKSIHSICIADLSGRKIASTDETAIGTEITENDYFIQGMKCVYVSDVYAVHGMSMQRLCINIRLCLVKFSERQILTAGLNVRNNYAKMIKPSSLQIKRLNFTKPFQRSTAFCANGWCLNFL